MNDDAANPILKIRGLCKQYVSRSALLRRRTVVTALDNVDFEVGFGKLVAVVGESGSGKSTLARCIARLEDSDQGDIWFRDRALTKLGGEKLRPFRSQIQLIFQDSAGALNPRFTAAEIVEEPLLIQGSESKNDRRRRALEMMEQVGLSHEFADRPVTQFSGGQRQRLAIARALVLRPSFLILDEALSGLDLSTQAQVLNLLLDLRAAHGLTYLFISHDLALVSQVADEIAVMHAGQIIERGATGEILSHPEHPQTIALVSSALALHGQMRARAARGAR